MNGAPRRELHPIEAYQTVGSAEPEDAITGLRKGISRSRWQTVFVVPRCYRVLGRHLSRIDRLAVQEHRERPRSAEFDEAHSLADKLSIYILRAVFGHGFCPIVLLDASPLCTAWRLSRSSRQNRRCWATAQEPGNTGRLVGGGEWAWRCSGYQILLNTRDGNLETMEFALFERTGR